MVKKSLSLVTAIAIAYVYLESQLQPGDALFLVTSSNIAVNAGLAAIACTGVYISFLDRFKYQQTYAAAVASAVMLSTLGLFGVMYSGFGNNFGGVIKPLDYLIILQLGVVLSIGVLTSQPATRRLQLPKLLSTASLKPLVSAWLPRPAPIPQRRRSAG
jgi:hypothetical protein